MSELIKQASGLLGNMYDAERGLFSYSTSIVDGMYQNVFDHPKAQRYTITTLAGLWKLAQTNSGLWNFEETVEAYIRHQGRNISDPGDQGLFLYVLVQCQHPRARHQYEIVKQLTNNRKPYCAQVLQDACWQLYGLIAYAYRFDDAEAQVIAGNCYKWLRRYFMNPETLFPYHQTEGLRKRFVSFGGITYFLKALYEYAIAFDDDYAKDLFKKGVRQVIARQGPMGEWAWFYDAESGHVMDWYEVYSVHQEAMAMLFLLPALDLGVNEARDAIDKSVLWLFGSNELNTRMMIGEPFFSYRSIRRKGLLQRQIRYARAIARATTERSAKPTVPLGLEVNKECRSYEMGWILYAWAGREDFPEFTSLKDL